ncbi:MAG: efflux RND transporter periplasmic adaptor subunit [Candidatus Brocadiia bacterium]
MVLPRPLRALKSLVTRPSRRRLGWAAGALAALAAAFGAGVVVARRGAPGERPPPSEPAARRPEAGQQEPAEEPTTWYCAMHPQIQQPEPGLCPICKMELVPLEEKAGGGLRRFQTTEAALELMELRTAPVERKFVAATVRMVGKVDYDETTLATVTAWVPGRIDRLFVDYTGITVREGDHMVSLYSPELYSAQQELLAALEALREARETELEDIRRNAQATVEAAREKLRLLGLSAQQVEAIERRGTASDHVTINAPAGGIVIRKQAQEGMYVRTGTPIYTIADLRKVWVKLDAYESDLQWLRYGQPVRFTTEAYPGEVFQGRIAFIDPTLDPRTRTVKVRVNVSNEDGRLKPQMFLRAVVRAQVARGGRVMEPYLAGKWMCPMHPSVVDDQAGSCEICGMPLARTESLGYVPLEEAEVARPLVVPATAPLITGTRAVVYVRVPDADQPTFEGREVVLGPRAGDYYLVRHGLEEGQRVVTHGNFKIDSALQIVARPSMMSPPGVLGPEGEGTEERVPAAFTAQLRKLQGAYARVLGAVRAGDIEPIRAAFQALGTALEGIEPESLTASARLVWDELAMRLRNDAAVGARVEDAEAARRELARLGDHVAQVRARFGLPPHERLELRPEALPRAFRQRLGDAVDAYLEAAGALAADDAKAAADALETMGRALEGVDAERLPDAAYAAWLRQRPSLAKALDGARGAEELAALRAPFALVSEQLAAVLRLFHPPRGRTLYLLECPMAFEGRGATWLQAQRQVSNPYFGASMRRCGEVVEEIR